VGWAEVVSEISGFSDGFDGGAADAFQVITGVGSEVGDLQCEVGAVLDDRKVLSEAIVQFGGETFAFAFLSGEQVARKFFVGLQFARLRLMQRFFRSLALRQINIHANETRFT